MAGEPAKKLYVWPDNSCEEFVGKYLNHLWRKPVARMHRRWYEALADRSKQYICIEAGRGSAKTTIASVCFALFNICESQDEDMHIISRSGGKTGTSSKIMRAVKRELESNLLLIHDYGIRRGQSWGEDMIEVCRGDNHQVRFYSLGKHSSIRGARGTVLIDDPQDSADCRSETVLAADEEWLLSDVLPVIIEDQRLIFIGTPISPLSLLSKVKDLPGFEVYSFPLEEPVDSGRSAWPEQYSSEFLSLRKQQLGIDVYGAEYLCRPKVPGTPVFRAEWFQHYDSTCEQGRRIQQSVIFKVAGMDCAESKREQADQTAIVTLGLTEGEVPDVYVLDVRAGHWTTKEGCEQLFQVFESWKQHESVVETRVAPPNKDAMAEEIETREKTYQIYVNLFTVKPHKDKVTRAMAIQPWCQEGRVFIDKHRKDHQALLSELTMFTGDQNYRDDRVDGFVHGMTRLKGRAQRAIPVSTGPDVALAPGVGFSHTEVKRGGW